MSKNLSDNINDLGKVSKKYIQARIDLIKLILLEKATEITSYLINSLVLILLGALVLMFSLGAFVAWYGQVYHDYLTGILLAVGILIVVIILFVVYRKKIVTTSVLENYSSILFEGEEKNKGEL
ncbi:hypothetical protein ACUNWD_05540 [Sunxiuqinia sp. A32]|uniref:hypothetical protein n=1 Tax=Sunxiuqinia sp. A32 TaxID=3461496 RepID=UPI0040465794